MRHGDDYIESLRDGRAVFLDGERVVDVTKHPAFAEAIRRIAELYDLARSDAARDLTTYVDPASGARYGAMWLIPRTAEDLEARRRVHRFWAQAIWDFVGTEFAGRQLQYEMFYSASQPVVNSRMFRSYDWASAKAMVDRCLGEY